MQTRNPGQLLKLADGRMVICYNKQPLKHKIIFHLINEDFAPIIGEDGKQKTFVKDIPATEFLKGAERIGKVD